MTLRASFSDVSAGDGNLLREIRQITLGTSPSKVRSETNNEKVSTTTFIAAVHYLDWILQR